MEGMIVQAVGGKFELLNTNNFKRFWLRVKHGPTPQIGAEINFNEFGEYTLSTGSGTWEVAENPSLAERRNLA